jgi:hypothetical protein
VFPTPAQLASWAGTSPGSHESAGRTKPARTRPGNPYLKGALGIAAMAAARSKNTYFSAKYRRLAARRGHMKALVAIEHTILTAAWHMLTNGELYQEPGPDYYTRHPGQDQSPRHQPARSHGIPDQPPPTPQKRITHHLHAPVATAFSYQQQKDTENACAVRAQRGPYLPPARHASERPRRPRPRDSIGWILVFPSARLRSW